MLIVIYAQVGLNSIIGLHCLARFATKASPFGFFFTLVWVLHYVLGNVLLLVDGGRLFGNIEFEQLYLEYIFSNIAGLYFLFVYIYLLEFKDVSIAATHLVPHGSWNRMLIVYLGGLFAIATFIVKMGVSSYFSTELASYRAILGEYVEGIGVYYYIGMLLIPATLLVLSYCIAYVNLRTVALAAIVSLVTVAAFAPLGGRGRIFNIIFILIINYWISKKTYNLDKLVAGRTILVGIGLAAVAIFWANVRDAPQDDLDLKSISYSGGLAADTTRLYIQAYIFQKYPAIGSLWGGHYAAAILGPFSKYAPFELPNLIAILSSDWYYDAIGVADLKSAVSPSFIGETYMNFGVLGVILAPFLFYGIITTLGVIFAQSQSLSLAVIVYYFQFNFFHGGVYNSFDTFAICIPLFLVLRFYILPSNRRFNPFRSQFSRRSFNGNRHAQ